MNSTSCIVHPPNPSAFLSWRAFFYFTKDIRRICPSACLTIRYSGVSSITCHPDAGTEDEVGPGIVFCTTGFSTSLCAPTNSNGFRSACAAQDIELTNTKNIFLFMLHPFCNERNTIPFARGACHPASAALIRRAQ